MNLYLNTVRRKIQEAEEKKAELMKNYKWIVDNYGGAGISRLQAIQKAETELLCISDVISALSHLEVDFQYLAGTEEY